MSLLDPIAPVRAAVGGLLTVLHDLLAGTGLDPAAGTTWLLAVALLVVVVRAALLPLAVRSYRSGLRMRALQPELARIRERFAGRSDAAARREVAERTAALYRERGIRPLAAFVPLLIQIPLFLGLVQALEHAAHASGTAALGSFAAAVAFGAPLAAAAFAGGAPSAFVGIAFLVISAGAQVLTQHVATAGAAPGGRLLLLLPVVTAAAGFAFPIGVTAYWACSALWTLGQQLVLSRVVRLA
ncbi:YidC/Oxa1 family membrane protein insertase [Amnibacterium kyonggiense]|uniref:Membrane protein insertase YidC n=1 Tax=Amnibacterium kyonggiense TaxID=595671 RepID=A0A4R7FGC2_9MICO|nr:membrane protein insertase YidC [Amnibacterium kyonggiense]TDS75715.1 YidC/Oxa1 family membrane protein insertase [Amnibacterium kyonggiense]